MCILLYYWANKMMMMMMMKRYNTVEASVKINCTKRRAYFNVPTGTDVLGDLKSVLERLVTRA